MTRKTFKTVNDILALTETIHRKINQFYTADKELSEDPRIKLLLSYIARQENSLQQRVAHFRREAPGQILDTYLQYMPDEIEDLERFVDWHPEGETSIEEVLSIILEFYTAMHTCYRRLAGMTPYQSAREVFDNLADTVQEKERDAMRQALAAEDI